MNPKVNPAMKKKYAQEWKGRSGVELKDWLALDTWTVEEGLLLIVGIDPQAAVVEWEGWVSALGCKINKVRILNARPLLRHPVFLAIPSPKSPRISDEGHSGQFTASWDVLPDAQEESVKWEKLSILQELKEKLSRLNRLWISGQHSGQRHPAAYFIEWAERKHVEIPWLSYAREMAWLPVSIKREAGIDTIQTNGEDSEAIADNDSDTPKFINRNEVIGKFQVKPNPDENFKFWDDKLSRTPVWLKHARGPAGKRGVSHLWKPLVVAHCLLEGVHKKSFMSLRQLDAAIHKGFPEWLDTWKEETQDER